MKSRASLNTARLLSTSLCWNAAILLQTKAAIPHHGIPEFHDIAQRQLANQGSSGTQKQIEIAQAQSGTDASALSDWMSQLVAGSSTEQTLSSG